MPYLFYREKNILTIQRLYNVQYILPPPQKKAKVVAAVWGTELIQFLAPLNIFHQDDFEEKDEKNKGFLAEKMLWKNG